MASSSNLDVAFRGLALASALTGAAATILYLSSGPKKVSSKRSNRARIQLTEKGAELSIASAPGKVILFGEHAVVYGRTAVAASLGLRTWVTSKRLMSSKSSSSSSRMRLRLHDLGFAVELSEDKVRELLQPSSNSSSGSASVALGDSALSTGSEAEDSSWEFAQFIELAGKALTEGVAPDVDALSSAFTRIVVPRLAVLAHELCAGAKDLVSSSGTGRQPITKPVESGVAAFAFLCLALQAYDDRSFDLDIDVRSLLPVGMGLGSSAAYSVALVTGLFELYGVRGLGSSLQVSADKRPDEPTRGMINGWAFVLEKIIHGNPSGVDNTVASYGGVVAFAKSERRLIGDVAALKLLLVNTRVPRTTSELVAGVRKRYERDPVAITAILDEIQAISERGLEILCEGAKRPDDIPYAELGTMVDRNHELLCDLGVGHPSLDVVCDAATRFGFNAKLTGAGGGGCALVVTKPNQESQSLEVELRHLGCDVFGVDVGGEGTAIHQLSELPWPAHAQ